MFDFVIDNFYLLFGTVFVGGVLLEVVFLVIRYATSSVPTDKTKQTVFDVNGKRELHSNNNHYYKNGKAVKVNGKQSTIYSSVNNNNSDESETSGETTITRRSIKLLNKESETLDVESLKRSVRDEDEQEVMTEDKEQLEGHHEQSPNDSGIFEHDHDSYQDEVDEITHSKHVNLVNTKPELRAEKVTDFAAIILTDDKRKDFFEIICVANGSYVIEAKNLEPEFVVIDCRAPVLARRALIRYLYRKLTDVVAQEVPEDEGLFSVIPASNRFEMKKNFKLNLFVSDPPDEEVSHKKKGSVRLKTTIDKISVWNQVGVQGSLLSHFLDPIYINSVIIPFEFNELSFHRHFVLNYTKEPKLTKCDNGLIDGIKRRIENLWVNGEWPEKVATNWIATEEGLEIIDCSTGRVVPELSTSRLSKHALNQCFREFLATNEHNLRFNQSLPMTYRKWKESAPNYRIQKQLLKVRYAVAGRQWTSLSPDLDMFY